MIHAPAKKIWIGLALALPAGIGFCGDTEWVEEDDGVVPGEGDLAERAEIARNMFRRIAPCGEPFVQDDQAYALMLLSRMVAIASSPRAMNWFGYLNATDLVGIGPCNNPLFADEEIIHHVPLPGTNGVTDLVWNDSSLFRNHMYVRLNGKIHDACADPATGTQTEAECLASAVDVSTSLERHPRAPSWSTEQEAGVISNSIQASIPIFY